MPGLEISAPPVPRSEEVLTPEALAFVADLDARFHGRRDELLAARRERRAQIARTGTLDFLDETADVRAGDWTVAPVPADLRDRRVEITGPTEPKMAINALNSGARVWLADLEDANTPHWRNVVGGQLTLRDATRGQLSFTSPEGKQYAVADPGPDARRPPPAPRLALRRGAPDGGRAPGRRRPGRLRAALLPQRPRAAGRRQRAVLLPAQDGVPPRGTALERRLHPRRGGARGAARLGPGDRAHRDDHRGLRDGRDPLRAARARRRAQRRPLGLPLQHHQELPRRRPRLHPPRPQRGDHGGADDEGLQRPAGPHLPPPRRLRDRRHGGVHPEPPRPRGQRAGVRQGARGQDPRGPRRLRRVVGGPPRPRPALRGGVRRGPRRARQPARRAPRRRLGLRRRPAVRRPDARASAPSRGCAATSGSACSTSTPGSRATAPPASTT